MDLCCQAHGDPAEAKGLEEASTPKDQPDATASSAADVAATKATASPGEQQAFKGGSSAKQDAEEDAKKRRQELQEKLKDTRAGMKEEKGRPQDEKGKIIPNRYGAEIQLPTFQPGKHVPVLAVLNPKAGAAAGRDILEVANRSPYFQDRFFNIVDLARGMQRGGLMDVFRIELTAAKDEAKAMGTRPRMVSGGGDGTGSFALTILFTALLADKDRAEDGLADTGNGFIWTDEELQESFPALVQMPLGSANDFANTLGWGQKYPGSKGLLSALSATPEARGRDLCSWIENLLDAKAPIVDFDLWGVMPQPGKDRCDFKVAELGGKKGSNPNLLVEGSGFDIHLQEAGKPVPFLICLYMSAGFGGYMTARFQLNRHDTPLKNRAEYARQGAGIVMERTPASMPLRLQGVKVDAEGDPYFPPRRHLGNQGRGYREVGFYNINWQAHRLHGYDRAHVRQRLFGCFGSRRKPATFNDGYVDMYRWKFLSILKNPGFKLQTDKKKDMCLTFDKNSNETKGVFFQWDGEARFAFSPTGEPFHIFIRKVASIPVVLGPNVDETLIGDVKKDSKPCFLFGGETEEERQAIRRRVQRYARGELDAELNATSQEMAQAGLKLSSRMLPITEEPAADAEEAQAAPGEQPPEGPAASDSLIERDTVAKMQL